jgi:hypothetical protein
VLRTVIDTIPIDQNSQPTLGNIERPGMYQLPSITHREDQVRIALYAQTSVFSATIVF